MASDAGRPNDSEENNQPQQTSRPLVVGIGASAGGLDALGRFFENVPEDTGMAFVVVQHLDPDYESALPELLSGHSSIPVTKVEEDTPVAPNNAYVIAPNTMLAIQGGVLRPSTPAQTQSRRNVIDAFFESLAEDQDGYAVGIVLSGSGSDGTLGLRAIKEAQGMTIAQEPGTADYDSMPQSAITSGCVDHVLTLEEMPGRLIQHASHLLELNQSLQEAPIDYGDNLRRICAIVRERTGHDFTSYKENTLVRRIQRRMQVNRIEGVSTYVQRLREDPREADLLQKELLIGVTNFFRDTEAFGALETDVIPRIFSEKRDNGPVRVWVIGCSTGEEAYSIAILMAEQRRKTGSSFPIQIFATDIDAQSLEGARRGWYPQGIADTVIRERLERYFTQAGDGYQVSQEIREMCVFSPHNLLSDPPFSRLDLVSCRNVLIYLQAEAQGRVMPLLHYGLRQGGYLFLGRSENIAAHSNLFDVVSRPHHLFRRKETSSAGIGGFQLGQPYTRPNRGVQAGQPPAQASRRRLGETFRRAILEEYAPAAVVITESGEILEVSGQTQPYVQLAQGAFQNNLFTMLRGGLLAELRNALKQASMDSQAAVSEHVAFRVGREIHYTRLTVRPVDQQADSRLFMVIFERDTPPEPSVQASQGDGQGAQADAAVREMENELRRAREDLQATIEELETQGEEMKSANEELTSMNEELQSANEELQASKEELQSVNEELHTINGELNKKIEELNRTNDDIENLLRSTDIAAIFLDMDMCVKRFTPVTRDIFPLIESDAGRPITDISSPFEDAGWMEDIRSVTHDLIPRERSVLVSRSGSWFIMRVLPYRTRTNVIDGTVVTFADVTELQRAELRAAELANVVDSSNDAIISRRLDGPITTWNRSAQELLGYTSDEMLGQNYHLRLLPPEDVEVIEALQRRVLDEETPAQADEVLLHKDGTPLDVAVSLSPVRGADGRITGFAVSIRDNSERKRLEGEKDKLSQELQEAMRSKDEFMAMLGHEIRNPLATISSAIAILKEPDLFDANAMQEAIDILERQSRHLNRLVEDLLEVTRVSRRSIQLKQERIDIASVARDAARDYSPLCDSLGLKLEIEVLYEPVYVWGDRDRLAQVLGNLLSNSCKFTPEGGNIFIQVSRAEEDTASIVVRDTGAGVSAETLPKLFQPFQSSGGRENRGSSGLGLGLALVKGIVELHGGTVQAHSEGRGRGFEVSISLPVER